MSRAGCLIRTTPMDDARTLERLPATCQDTAVSSEESGPFADPDSLAETPLGVHIPGMVGYIASFARNTAALLDEFSTGDREADNLRLDTSPVEDDGFSQPYELLGLSSPAHSLSGTIKLPNPPPTDPAADAAATKLWSFVRLHVRAASGRQRDNVLRALNAATHELIPETNMAPSTRCRCARCSARSRAGECGYRSRR